MYKISHITETRETIKLDYNNGIKCTIRLIDGKIDYYGFYNSTTSLYLVDDINDYINCHWSEHRTLYENQNKFTKLSDFNNIDFSKLYYLGFGHDGKIKDINGKIITSVITFDYSFMKIYCDINTLETSQTFFNKIKDLSYIKDAKIVEIPYYNCDGDDSHSVEFNCVLPQNIFDLCQNSKEDNVKIAIINHLKSI